MASPGISPLRLGRAVVVGLLPLLCAGCLSISLEGNKDGPSGTLIDVPGVAAVVTLASVMLALPAVPTVKEKNCEAPRPCS